MLLVSTTAAGATDANLRKLGPHGRSLASPVLDFSAFSAGDLVSALGDGVTVFAMKKTSAMSPLVATQAMIFDSANPTGGDVDLGTPNQSFGTGGPGIGKAGKKGKLFANSQAHGKVLIISEDNNAVNPDDNQFGGALVFIFDPPRYVDSIGLLDNDGKDNALQCHTSPHLSTDL